jgi:hypothetical protein
VFLAASGADGAAKDVDGLTPPAVAPAHLEREPWPAEAETWEEGDPAAWAGIKHIAAALRTGVHLHRQRTAAAAVGDAVGGSSRGGGHGSEQFASLFASTKVELPLEPEPERPGTPRAAAGRRFALVVGNSRYHQQAVLPCVSRDAQEVAQALGACGFAVTALADLNRSALAAAVRPD